MVPSCDNQCHFIVIRFWRAQSAEGFIEKRSRWRGETHIVISSMLMSMISDMVFASGENESWLNLLGVLRRAVKQWYYWWKKSCSSWDIWNLVNNGINYQPQLVSRISSTVGIAEYQAVRLAWTCQDLIVRDVLGEEPEVQRLGLKLSQEGWGWHGFTRFDSKAVIWQHIVTWMLVDIAQLNV